MFASTIDSKFIRFGGTVSGISIALGMLPGWIPGADSMRRYGHGGQTVRLALGFYNDERLIWKIFAAFVERE